ncbi:tetratricopeptide repeat protein [uncultured Treponema sp.]|uniref:tetratricopeptide repeat protein n=1 Tax=uncultured Treponema sp. TaxID=162155 RepID=UPI0025E6CBB3|nr:tetratricopeptide repeat protein [uncultured Treponema sp.]
MKKRHFFCLKTFLFVITAALFFSCTKTSEGKKENETLSQLTSLLEDPTISAQSRYAVINRIANLFYSQGRTDDMVLFLTDWVETHPGDTYDSYWLFMVASNYLKSGQEPLAEYYYERIINNFPDLLVNDESIHFTCLQHLIQISKSSENRINYFNRIILNFPQKVSITEMYIRLALEYENAGEWDMALKSYALFLEQPDSSTIQIAGLPNAYTKARQTVDFSKSTKDWTFKSLSELESAVKKAISSYNWRALDRYRSKVNFFAMSWKSSESDPNALENFSMHNFMLGNRIRYNAELDESSTPTEAYLRTWGWTSYVNVWYLYFRKVDFPADPEIHGRWEWAGIYFGEKL